MSAAQQGPTSATAPHHRVENELTPRSAFAGVAALLRRIIGAPDYPAYCRHIAERHPGATPLTEAEFVEERMKARYSTPGNRCC